MSNNRDRDGPSGGGPFRESRSGFGSDFEKSGPSFSRAFKDRDDRDMGRSSDRGGNRMFNKRFDRDDRGSRSSLFGKKFDRDDRDREFKREPAPVEKGKVSSSWLLPKCLTVRIRCFISKIKF